MPFTSQTSPSIVQITPVPSERKSWPPKWRIDFHGLSKGGVIVSTT